MAYPHISPHILNDDLIEHFTLKSEERFLLAQWRTDANILGFAVVLKSFVYLGYPPDEKTDVPVSVISYIGRQLGLSPTIYEEYRWKDSIWKTHLAAIREFTGFQPWTDGEGLDLVKWLVEEASKHPSRIEMKGALIQRCRQLKVELPTEKELYRLVGSAWWQFQNNICELIARRLSPEIRQKMDLCLECDKPETDRYEWLKATPRMCATP